MKEIEDTIAIANMLGFYNTNSNEDEVILVNKKKINDFSKIKNKDVENYVKSLDKLLKGIMFRASEAECSIYPFVIKTDQKDIKEIILNAFGIKKKFQKHNIFDKIVIKKFFMEGDQESFEEEDETYYDKDDEERVIEISKKLKKLKNNFYFTLTDYFVCAPTVWGGVYDNDYIIGVVGMRVWT